MPRPEKKDEASERALAYSKSYGGKVGIVPRVPVRSLEDFSIWYTPGVAAVSRRIGANPEPSFDYTGRWNTVAVITDGSRVLGLGNIGPDAALPVMEGKALIYDYLGGVNAVPLLVRATDEEHLISIIEALEPAFGGINLEDIESPKCFDVLERLRAEMRISVWHDDQLGTAAASLAGSAGRVHHRHVRSAGVQEEAVRTRHLGASDRGPGQDGSRDNRERDPCAQRNRSTILYKARFQETRGDLRAVA